MKERLFPNALRLATTASFLVLVSFCSAQLPASTRGPSAVELLGVRSNDGQEIANPGPKRSPEREDSTSVPEAPGRPFDSNSSEAPADRRRRRRTVKVKKAQSWTSSIRQRPSFKGRPTRVSRRVSSLLLFASLVAAAVAVVWELGKAVRQCLAQVKRRGAGSMPRFLSGRAAGLSVSCEELFTITSSGRSASGGSAPGVHYIPVPAVSITRATRKPSLLVYTGVAVGVVAVSLAVFILLKVLPSAPGPSERSGMANSSAVTVSSVLAGSPAAVGAESNALSSVDLSSRIVAFSIVAGFGIQSLCRLRNVHRERRLQKRPLAQLTFAVIVLGLLFAAASLVAVVFGVAGPIMWLQVPVSFVAMLILVHIYRRCFGPQQQEEPVRQNSYELSSL